MSADTFEAARQDHPDGTFTDWLRGQPDRLRPDLSPRRHRRVARHFRRTMTLERAFFEAASGPPMGNDGPV